jgi:predicted DNA-binding WGR domain protein
MATKKGTSKKSSSKKEARGSGPREKINSPTNKMYGRRAAKGTSKGGQFTEMDDIGKSLAADRRTKAKTKVKPGYGDQGDQPKKSSTGGKAGKGKSTGTVFKGRTAKSVKKGSTTFKGRTTFRGRTK